MATKSSAKTETKKNSKTTKKSTTSKKNTKQNLLYIMSSQCGWCKKADPIVEELVNEGYKITKLDVTNPEEAATANAAKSKHNAQCGTPLFLDEESGNQKCGFAEKEIVEKWAKGEEIPAPPQPKSPPPPPPTDFQNEDQVNTFKEAYEKWGKENDHLPRILPVDQVLQRMEQAQQMRSQQQAGGMPPGAPGGSIPSSEGAGDRNIRFYYIVEGTERAAVMADPTFIKSLKQQYYYREQSGELTKVVGDVSWGNEAVATRPSGPGARPSGPGARPSGPGAPPTISKGSKGAPAALNPANKREVDPKVKQRAKEIASQRTKKNESTTNKSKTNKKTVPSF